MSSWAGAPWLSVMGCWLFWQAGARKYRLGVGVYCCCSWQVHWLPVSGSVWPLPPLSWQGQELLPVPPELFSQVHSSGWVGGVQGSWQAGGQLGGMGQGFSSGCSMRADSRL